MRQSVGIERLALCAMGAAGLIACHFSASHQQRVTRLVFIASGESDVNRQLLRLRKGSPEVEAELRGALLGGVGDSTGARSRVRNHGAETRWLLLAEGHLTRPTLFGAMLDHIWAWRRDDHWDVYVIGAVKKARKRGAVSPKSQEVSARRVSARTRLLPGVYDQREKNCCPARSQGV